ncbi:Uncharacterised protein [Vibrio cholerae]|nr:Uncharacterised protein [Vibrio cholerae]
MITFTAFGLNTSASSSISTANVAIGALHAAKLSATWRIIAGGIKGSSPCTFTTM